MFVIKNLILTVMAIGLTWTAKAQEQTLQEAEIPVEISTFIEQHFPDANVTEAVKEKDDGGVIFEVKLSNYVELEFNENKEITSIDSDSELPESVIPDQLQEYVTAQYPDRMITSWELDDNHQKLELDDDTDLIFDLEGTFQRVDS